MLENTVQLRMDVQMVEQQFHMMIQKHFAQLQPEIEAAITAVCEHFDFREAIYTEVRRQIEITIRNTVTRGMASLNAEMITRMLQETLERVAQGVHTYGR